MRRFSVLVALLAGALLLSLPTLASAAGKPPAKDNDTHIQLLAFNDFHGQLQPAGVKSSSGRIQTGIDADGKPVYVAAGGMAYMATWVDNLRAAHATDDASFVVSAGDNVGASPFVSALFHDEPTIEAMNQLGVVASAVGNHEFDEGPAELLRLQNGGCNAIDGCQAGPFGGADFQYLTSNVFWSGTNDTLFPAAKVVRVGNAKIGFIGATLEGAPSIVTAAGTAGLEFRAEAAAINTTVHELRNEQGVRSFVVLLHQGGQQNPPAGSFADVNGCVNPSGDMMSILDSLDPMVDVVVTGHTHNAYVCDIDGKLVTSAASNGRLLTDIELTIDHQSKTIVGATATNEIVTNDVTPDPDMQALIDGYAQAADVVGSKVIGTISADITRSASTKESALGDVLADAQLYAMAPYGAVAAITNPGGIRTDLIYDPSGAEQPGEVTYAELFAVQPFNNYMVAEDLTGQDLYDALNEQWSGANAASDKQKLLQVSNGFTYAYETEADGTIHVVPGSLEIGGAPVVLGQSYRIAMNNFLAGGGDGFPALANGKNAYWAMLDIDAAVAYFGTHPDVAPGPMNRVTVG